MSIDTFLLAVKSTVDKIGVEMAAAQAGAPKFVDLDDATATEEAMSKPDPVFIWEMSTFVEAPKDPLYRATFSVGVRAMNDPANYGLLKLLGVISGVFQPGTTIEVRDWSGTLATQPQGRIFITKSYVNAQGFDRAAGVRMISIDALVQRWL
jgi:hypothetical protein